METKPLVVAISSRALFDLDESHRIFEEQGTEAYCRHQIENEDVPLAPGGAFNLARKLLALNDNNPKTPKVEIILLSRNSADTGLRVFNSIQHHELSIIRAVFTSGSSPYRYVAPFGANLFLSTSPEDVAMALEAGIAAATILPSNVGNNPESEELRIAFDGDAVVFSDDSEKIYKEKGLEAFTENETQTAREPLPGGPFKDFLMALNRIQTEYPENDAPIRTALVTARSAPAHERVIRTLRAWDIRIDEAIFLGGKAKGPFLKAFGADIFFDDQEQHCHSAKEHVATGHVPHGIANKKTIVEQD
ncbi:5'-nucleotidase [Methylophaga sp. OBS1]|jgi:5'-nucleotidase|uniref:5'-nucleotidase n=1 Tax=Methylophaga sp. OBS1 TaxID=2991933 RepID=UPI002256412C|nr:5'-nucleotidase [Methylophaga sp. OBS1]MCX4191315.1 5'-nucleotidase [Methylophaga sp. OBS1]MCX4191739.1 5'-nucleotidase [Methylophaga sp. OBS1]